MNQEEKFSLISKYLDKVLNNEISISSSTLNKGFISYDILNEKKDKYIGRFEYYKHGWDSTNYTFKINIYFIGLLILELTEEQNTEIVYKLDQLLKIMNEKLIEHLKTIL